MMYTQEQVLQAFSIFSLLARQGYVDKDEVRWYLADDALRGLVDRFAKEVECTLFLAGDTIYLIPLALTSPFHVSNDTLKKDYLPSRAVNLDIYLMYAAIIIFFGEFYDSYQTREATKDFLPLGDWLHCVNDRLETIKAHDREQLKKWEQEYEFNWTGIIDKWEAMDDIR
ncbi:MAG: non-ribosomal peptide synthetase module, partial [Clostridia bacterium]|nr:non-ribosomal peptide synthetase module [Clostridia bacterium]